MKISSLLYLIVLFHVNRESVTLPIKVEKTFKLPKTFTSDTVIRINGTIKIQNNSLFVALVDAQNNRVCDIIYDTSTSIITIESKLSPTSTIPYTVEASVAPLPFSLLMVPKKFNMKHSINFHFEVDDNGPLALEPCEVENFESIYQIDVTGAAKITNLQFEFKN